MSQQTIMRMSQSASKKFLIPKYSKQTLIVCRGDILNDFCNCRSTCRLELTQRERNADPLGENKDVLLPKKDRCQSRHLENECREKATNQRPSIHEENIVFIEERKILVIPKSKTSIT